MAVILRLALLALLLVPQVAFGQGAVKQNGPVVQGHLPMWVGNGLLMDAGGSPGAGLQPANKSNAGSLSTGLGVVNSGLGFCDYSAYASAAYSSICFGFDGAGNGRISLDRIGGGLTPSMSISINGTVYPFPGAGNGNVLGPSPSVVGDIAAFNSTNGTLLKDLGPGAPTYATNAALKAATAGIAPTVYRAGFTTAGDGGAARYQWSSVACSLSAGAGDNGSQVAPTVGTGCWIADFAETKPTPMVWGCVGNGIVVDTTCVQAAMTAMNADMLYTGPHNYKLDAQVTYCGRLIGERSQVTGGFVPSAANLSLVKLTCASAEMEGVLVEMGAFTNTAGTAIDATANVNAASIHDNYINAPFVGIDLAAGALKSALHNSVINIRSNGVGIRVGHGTTNAGTLETQVGWNWLSGDPAGTNVTCVLYEDVGGIQHSHNTAAQCSTKLIAGANQIIAFGFLSDEMGDANATGGSLQINTTDASARMYSLEFNGPWAASALLGDCYDIRNSGGGLVTGIKFNSPRAYNCYGHGMLIGAGTETITGVEINNPSICGAGGGSANTYDGIIVQSVNNTGGKIVGGKVGNGCDNQIGPVMGTGIVFIDASPGWQVYNVDLTMANGTGGAIGSALPYGAGTRWINNPGYAPTTPYTVTVSASPFTFTPGPAPETAYITGGTVSDVKIGGVTVCTASPCVLSLNPLQAAVVTYSVLPTMVSAIHP